VSRKERNWYQNEADEEIKGVYSRNKVKHNERSDHLFLETDRWMDGRTDGRQTVTLRLPLDAPNVIT